MTKAKILILIILISSCSRYLDSYQEAKKCYSNTEYSKSLTILNVCLSDNPDFINGYLLRAKVHLHLFDTVKAVNDYSFIVRDLDPQNTYAFYELSRIHCATKSYKEALSDIGKAIHTKGDDLVWIERKNNPFYPSGYDVNMNKLRFQRGLVYFGLKDFNNALKDFDFITSVYRTKDVNYFRGNCLIQLGYPDAAYEAYKKASDWGSTKADSILQLFH